MDFPVQEAAPEAVTDPSTEAEAPATSQEEGIPETATVVDPALPGETAAVGECCGGVAVDFTRDAST